MLDLRTPDLHSDVQDPRTLPRCRVSIHRQVLRTVHRLKHSLSTWATDPAGQTQLRTTGKAAFGSLPPVGPA